MWKWLVLAMVLAGPARADVAEAVRDHVLPGYAQFAGAAEALAAVKTCDPEALRPAYQAAFDAWMGVAHLHLGPVEEDGRGLAIAFWPDPKGLGWKHQQALLMGDGAALEPAAFAEQSVAARGFFALERLLYPVGEVPGDPCPLIRATTGDLARVAEEVREGWVGGYADLVLTAGEPGNAVFLTADEARQALFTQLVTGLEFDADARLGRPLGTFERPLPDRAEAVASGRSLRNLVLSLQALRGLAGTLSGDVPKSAAAFDAAIAAAEGLGDPVFAGVADPGGRLKVEILQQKVRALREVVIAELGGQLGVDVGFNAADGD
jgi:predicted lipoprotein